MPHAGLAVAVALLAGVLAAMRLPVLPPVWIACLVAIVGAGLWWRFARRRWLGALLFGFGWAMLQGQWALDSRIPPTLVGEDLRIEGRVLGLPQRNEAATRFDLRVTAGEGEAATLVGRRLRLGWYGEPPQLAPGSTWAMRVRLKRPRGALNPGGFDFEKRALEQRLAATGYVRDVAYARELKVGRGIDTWRGRMSARIAEAVPSSASRFVRALALGDTRGLDERDWEILRATGLTHLIAISGFHVGLVAGFGALLARWLYWLWPRLGLRRPRPQGMAIAALLCALGYTALAGFALPTVRTALMIAVALLATGLRRPRSMPQSLALTLITIGLVDPLAVLGPGFWLSFVGVAWLLWCLPHEPVIEQQSIEKRSVGKPVAGRLRPFVTAQVVATLGLLPLTVWFFGQASLAGPLANLVGIPWISLVVVPLSLLGAGLEALWSGTGVWPLHLAAWTMQILWYGLERIADWRGALVWLPEPSLPALALALFGAFWLLLPRGVPGKPLALLLWLPLLWPAQEPVLEGEAELALIDVGQGLSVLLRTADHALLYDAGPAYAGGLDAGEAMVVPTLRALGVARLDTLVISHGDNDHAGGAGAVRRAYAPTRVQAPEGWVKPDMTVCRAGQHWAWDGVRFHFLHPPEFFPYLRNESSCVLRVETAGGAILLAGDIGEIIEGRLVREQADAVRADVLVAPHHGSAGSSSQVFLDAVRPRRALIGVGHGNRFGHPAPEALARYRAVGARLSDTATGGFLSLRLRADGLAPIKLRRESHRRFWHEAGSPVAGD